jgi:hypothetical protein
MTMIKTTLIKEESCKFDLPYLGSIFFDKDLEESIGKPDKLLKSNFMKDLDKILERVNIKN